MAKNLYNFSIQDIDGNTVNLDKFKGKPILLVNTASRCGFTKQYANLSNLHREYFKKNLVIIGTCLLYTSPSPRDISGSRMPSSA